MNTEYYIEVIVGVREDLLVILQDDERTDEVPNKIAKLLDRSSGSSFTDVNGENKTWTIGRFWGDARQQVDNQYGGDFDAFQYDRDNGYLNFLETMFTEEWHWFRPLSCWRWSNGLPLGCEYANLAGDVIVDDPDRVPWFPWDDAKARRYWPDRVVEPAVYDEDGVLITPAITEDVLHDGQPDLWHHGQMIGSRDSDGFRRRVRQVTTHEPLDASIFNVAPWSP